MTRRKLIARYDLRNPSLRLPETGFALTVQEAPEAPAKAPEGAQEPDPRQLDWTTFDPGCRRCNWTGKLLGHDHKVHPCGWCKGTGGTVPAPATRLAPPVPHRCMRCLRFTPDVGAAGLCEACDDEGRVPV